MPGTGAPFAPPPLHATDDTRTFKADEEKYRCATEVTAGIRLEFSNGRRRLMLDKRPKLQGN